MPRNSVTCVTNFMNVMWYLFYGILLYVGPQSMYLKNVSFGVNFFLNRTEKLNKYYTQLLEVRLCSISRMQ
jgi:hypothetical protein